MSKSNIDRAQDRPETATNNCRGVR